MGSIKSVYNVLFPLLAFLFPNTRPSLDKLTDAIPCCVAVMRSLPLGTPHCHKFSQREVTVYARDGPPASPFQREMFIETYAPQLAPPFDGQRCTGKKNLEAILPVSSMCSDKFKEVS